MPKRQDQTSLADLVILQHGALANASGRLAVCRPRTADEGTKRQIDATRRRLASAQKALVRYMVKADPVYLAEYVITADKPDLLQAGGEIGRLIDHPIEHVNANALLSYSKDLLRHSRLLMSSLPGDPTGKPETG